MIDLKEFSWKISENKFMHAGYNWTTILKCLNCGLKADEYIGLSSSVCPNCGEAKMKKITAKWVGQKCKFFLYIIPFSCIKGYWLTKQTN